MSCKIKIRNKNRFVKLGFQEQSKIRKNKRSIIGFQKNKEQYNNTIVGLGDRELWNKKGRIGTSKLKRGTKEYDKTGTIYRTGIDYCASLEQTKNSFIYALEAEKQ